MLAIGYEEDDGAVAYVVLDEDSLENIILDYVYNKKDFMTGNGESKTAGSKQEYFDKKTQREDDTRFRFLKQKDGVWVIRDYYKVTSHDMTSHDMTITNVMEGGKRRKTRKTRKNYTN